MQAQVGDELSVKGRHQGDEDSHCEIIEIIGADGAPPYLVRRPDGYESLLFYPLHTELDHPPRSRSGHATARAAHPSRDGRGGAAFRSAS